ncbi:NAPE-hydrolyzing phospholipase D [Pyricularia oryzae]|nr:NAPE-hydrolyzing phospholipase D [Pyricularia oryzae]KAI7928252.1 NAPE-hydrolyzing phospholipase D [Pyricularia oryzae]
MYASDYNLDSKMVEARPKDDDRASTRKSTTFTPPDHVTAAALARGGSTEPTRHPQPFNPTDKRVLMHKRLIRPLGFTSGYSFACFVVFAGTLMGFTLARAQFIDIQGVMCSPSTAGGPLRHAAPGECFYFVSGATHERFGIVLHLATVLPASFLACFQLLPVLRARAPAFHRANGYMVILLSLLGVAGGLMITGNAFSGALVTQMGFGFGAAAFLVALGMGWLSMRRMRVDQHRAWMLRAWFYVGAIVTTRILMSLGAHLVTVIGGYYMPEPCDKIQSMLGRDRTLSKYPTCKTFFDGEVPSQHTLVVANMAGEVDNISAALDAAAGAALWVAFVLHAAGVEIYYSKLHLTPEKSERLRETWSRRRRRVVGHDLAERLVDFRNRSAETRGQSAIMYGVS